MKKILLVLLLFTITFFSGKSQIKFIPPFDFKGGSSFDTFLNIPTLTISPVNPLIRSGSIYFNSSTGKIRIYDGTNWSDISGSVSNIIGTTNRIIVSNSSGVYTISAPQDINTGSSPTFTNLNLSGSLSAASNISTTNGNLNIATSSGSFVTNNGATSIFSGSAIMLDLYRNVGTTFSRIGGINASMNLGGTKSQVGGLSWFATDISGGIVANSAFELNNFVAGASVRSVYVIGNQWVLGGGASPIGSANLTAPGGIAIGGTNGGVFYQDVNGVSKTSAAITGIIKGNGTSAPGVATPNVDYLPVSGANMTGIPTVPTAAIGTNTDQVASTAFATTADNLKQNLITLTTNGSGAATFNQSTGALNIPTPSGGGSGTVTSITPGIGFNSSTPITTSGTLNLDTVTTISGVARKGFVTNGLAAKQNTLTLTTTGTSGAATLTGSTLNIPNYAAGTNYWSRTSNVLSTANANDILTLGSNFGGGTSVVYATGSSGTNGLTGQSDTQAGVIGRGTGTTGIGGSFESALNSGSGGATIQVLSNGTGDIAMFSSKISGVVTNQVYVRNNGLVEYIVDKSSLYGSRSVPDVAYVQSLTNKYPYLSKTANYTVLTTDWANTNTLTITVDASAGAVTITLPTSSSVAGKIINIKKMDSSINTVTVNGGGTNIDGTSTSVITMQYGNAMIQSISTQYITL